MSSPIYSLSREIEMTAVDAEVEAECYQEQFDKYEISVEFEESFCE
jgi:hypothetical protein